jgi:N-acyl-phosphatidylethanolamine-hydrolysing phospholipase D
VVNAKKLIGILCFLIGIVSYNHIGSAMEKKPYHHLPDGTFRNPEGSPKRDANFKWSYKIFNQEKKKLDMTVPKEHVIDKEKVLSDLRKYQEDDYVAWIGHATFLIKLGNTTIITDPVFSKNAGPLIFGPKRFTEPALELNEIPKTDIFLLTHNHYDHQDMTTIRRFPFKNVKVLLPLKLGKYFTKNGYKDVNEMDWYEEIEINKNLKITFLPAVHWSKRSLTDTNKTLWGNFLIEYNGKKLLFGCDTGIGNIYKDIGNKYGPIDLTFINIGAYNFYPIMPYKDKSIYHTNPEEALEVAKNLKSKKVIGMHWGTFVLSLEPIMEPPVRFKANAEKYGFKKEDAIVYRIGEFGSLKKLLNYN